MDFIKDLNIDKVRNLAEDAFNQVKPKNEVEARVYEVLSHKNWGASTTLMNEISQDTFDYERFLIITKLMWEAIETPRPAAWRVIFKGLTLLEHLVKNGSERCVDDARNHSHLLRNLDRFNYYEGTIDRGSGVREKAKQVVDILQDDERIREERMKARQLREKFAGRSTTSSGGAGGGGTKYAGYGNSDATWNTGSKGGGSRGYGEGGIGSSSGKDSYHGYAGRYGEGIVDSAPAAARPPATTTAKKSSKSYGTKVKKLKKKEKKTEASAAPEALEIDLFSFDTSLASGAPAADDSFDAFQAAPTPASAPAAVVPVPTDGDFGDFQQIAPTSAVQFDALVATAPAPDQRSALGAFGAPHSMTKQQPMNTMNTALGNNSLQNQQQHMPAVSAPATTNAATPAEADDDFGDFEEADSMPVKSPENISDPLSKLISLDGLSKNVKKVDKSSSSQQQVNVGGGTVVGGVAGVEQQGFQALSQKPIMGTGRKGDVGEVFGQLMASGNQLGQMGSMMGQQQMMNQHQNNYGAGGKEIGSRGMGMTAGGNMGTMGGQQLSHGMGMMHGQHPQQQRMMNTMVNNVGMMGGVGQMRMVGQHQGMEVGNMGMIGGNMGMMGGNMGMMGGQQGMMQSNMMVGQQGGAMVQGSMMGSNMMGNSMMGENAMGGGPGMMGGQSGQGQFR